MTACMELVGFGTSKKVKNHWPRVDVKGQGIVRGPRRGMEGLGMDAKGFG